jgi:hypothetical protein
MLMAEFPVLPASTPGVQAPTGATPALRSDKSESSPAFEALLERLTARAAELDAKSRGLERPEDLPGAVDTARASLEDALTLGERLLEAWQAARRGEVRP